MPGFDIIPRMATTRKTDEERRRAVLSAYGLAADAPEHAIVAHLFGLYAERTKGRCPSSFSAFAILEGGHDYCLRGSSRLVSLSFALNQLLMDRPMFWRNFSPMRP